MNAPAPSYTDTHPAGDALSAWIDPRSATAFSRTGWIVASCLLAVVLTPILAFPISSDQAMFLTGARKILEGSIYYRDVLDIKPPFIYYLYSLIAFVGGGSGAAVRIFDFLLQGATCWMIIALVRRISSSDTWALLAALLYAVTYLSIGFVILAQTESLAGIISIGIVWLLTQQRTRMGLFAAGVLAGIAFNAKFTFGVLLVAALLGELLFRHRNDHRPIWIRWALIIAGFAAAVALLLLFLLGFGVVDEFVQMQQFTRTYVALSYTSPFETLQSLIQLPPMKIADRYTFTLTLATIGGVVLALPGSPDVRSNAITASGADVIRLCGISFVLLMAGVIAEGRYYDYHMIRITAVGVIPAAYAILRLFAGVLAHAGRLRLITVMILLVPTLVFSPLPRYAWLSVAPESMWLVSGRQGRIDYYHRMRDKLPLAEIEALEHYYRSRKSGDDTFYAFSSMGGLLHYSLDYIPDHPLFHSALLLNPHAPQQWEDSLQRYLRSESPRFLVVQHNETISEQTGTDLTSIDRLLMIPGIRTLLDSNYSPVMHGESFTMYIRNGQNDHRQPANGGPAHQQDDTTR